ncbi:hypothetical protein TRICI_000890 [Trichomonascus ciferrii]|uniref:Uncharacterized protein n=1 Tax=Trichomonascus ciferrii TaxID=44093 RepID=A0A642VAV4_9ASCO|nr:hypothetical protein TRICI_000890 [Trichomonascus ciferrii]
MAFNSIFGSGGGSKPETSASTALNTATPSTSSADLKRQVQEQVGQELAIANATELVNVSTFCCSFWVPLLMI